MIKQQQQQKQVFGEENMSNLTSAASCEVSVSSSNTNRGEPNSSYYDPQQLYAHQSQSQNHDEQPQQPPSKKKRNLPGNPDPEAEVIALSPKTLLARNRFVCEICNKGFQRDQNLQLHRRGHNLPWKLKQRTNKDVIRKKVYVCPETSCVHHDPSRALGDLTGIKKHFCRKHGEKKWKCEKCSKKYAVQSDWKAHSKVCGTREYRCDCGTLFSRRDSFITHRAFCDALAEETARSTTASLMSNPVIASNHLINQFNTQQQQEEQDPVHAYPMKREQHHQSNIVNLPPWLSCTPTLVGPSPSSTIDLSSPPPPSSSIFIQDHQQPSSNPMVGPTTSSNTPMSMNKYVPSLGGGSYHTQTSPHMSATALLQKAAQMGSTITKISDHQPHHFHHHHGHVSDTPPAPTPPTPTTTPAGLFGLHLSSRDQFPAPPPSTYVNDMMINDESSSPFAGFHGTVGGHTDGNNNKNNDGLTRDFLGLRPLSQSDIFTIAGFGNCMDNSNPTSSHNNHQNTH